MMTFCMMTAAVSLIVFGQTYYNESYWTPLIPLMLLPLFLKMDEVGNELINTGMAVFTAIALLFATNANVKEPYIDWVPNDLEQIEVAQWLVDNGYTKGVAEFWDSNIITELSNGKIEMWTVKSLKSPDVYEWLQHKSHAEAMPEDGFVLLKIEDYNVEGFQWGEIVDYVVYQDDSYIVYQPDSFENWFNIMGRM